MTPGPTKVADQTITQEAYRRPQDIRNGQVMVSNSRPISGRPEMVILLPGKSVVHMFLTKKLNMSNIFRQPIRGIFGRSDKSF